MQFRNSIQILTIQGCLNWPVKKDLKKKKGQHANNSIDSYCFSMLIWLEVETVCYNEGPVDQPDAKIWG